jgi:hypothetical protein
MMLGAALKLDSRSSGQARAAEPRLEIIATLPKLVVLSPTGTVQCP